MRKSNLRVLLYHSVSANGHRDALTVSRDQLEEQFRYLRSKGYSPILLSDLIAFCDRNHPLPDKPVLITFDDGFRNNIDIAYPLAKKYGIKINLFLVPAFMRMGQYREEPCLKPEDLVKTDPALLEVGLHSYAHVNYGELIPSKIEADLERCKLSMNVMGVSWQPCLAYPFGAFPRRPGYNQDRLFEILEEKGIRLAFRIGNRVNRLPLRQRFLIQRLDIRGNEPFLVFRLSLRFGKKFFKMTPLISAIYAIYNKNERDP